MLKVLYEILVSPLGLPINPIWEYLIILLVGEIAHELAFWISPGGRFGSLIYWVSKFLVFIAAWAILYGIISAVKFVINNWIWFIIVGIILLIVSIILIIIFKKRQN